MDCCSNLKCAPFASFLIGQRPKMTLWTAELRRWISLSQKMWHFGHIGRKKICECGTVINLTFMFEARERKNVNVPSNALNYPYTHFNSSILSFSSPDRASIRQHCSRCCPWGWLGRCYSTCPGKGVRWGSGTWGAASWPARNRNPAAHWYWDLRQDSGNPWDQPLRLRGCPVPEHCSMGVSLLSLIIK